jgi:hypothetical protein
LEDTHTSLNLSIPLISPGKARKKIVIFLLGAMEKEIRHEN